MALWESRYHKFLVNLANNPGSNGAELLVAARVSGKEYDDAQRARLVTL